MQHMILYATRVFEDTPDDIIPTGSIAGLCGACGHVVLITPDMVDTVDTLNRRPDVLLYLRCWEHSPEYVALTN